MTQNDLNRKIRELAEVFSKVDDCSKLELLLDGILTPGEIEGIHMRWNTLKLLKAGVTQREIMNRLGISLGKISRGSRIMKYGNPDFRELVNSLLDETGKEEEEHGGEA